MGKNKDGKTGYRGIQTNSTFHGPTLCEDIKGAGLWTMQDVPSFAVRSRVFASSERYFPNSLNNQPQDFPGGPEAKTTCFQRRGQGSIPGQGTRSHKLQLRVCLLKLKILPATTKTWHIQINKYMLERNQSLKCCAVRQYHLK